MRRLDLGEPEWLGHVAPYDVSCSLDVEGETLVIGKPSGSDEKLGKATYPALFGVDASRRRCDELLQSALTGLAPFGDAAAPLKWLARYIVERGK